VANKAYPKGKKHLVTDVNLETDSFKVVLIDTGAYSFDESHEFLSSIASGARVAVSPTLTNTTVTLVVDPGEDYMVWDADDTVFSAVPATQPTAEAYAVYKDTGSAATSSLLFFIDRDAANNPISIIPNGGDLNLAFPDGITRIG
jgi:hypothetical protein